MLGLIACCGWRVGNSVFDELAAKELRQPSRPHELSPADKSEDATDAYYSRYILIRSAQDYRCNERLWITHIHNLLLQMYPEHQAFIREIRVLPCTLVPEGMAQGIYGVNGKGEMRVSYAVEKNLRNSARFTAAIAHEFAHLLKRHTWSEDPAIREIQELEADRICIKALSRIGLSPCLIAKIRGREALAKKSPPYLFRQAAQAETACFIDKI
jgi:hypothetical protein